MASMSTTEVEELVYKLEQLAAEDLPPSILNDNVLRRKLREATQSLNTAVQWPSDSVHLIAYGALYSSMARVGVDTKTFEVLGGSTKPMSSEEVAEKTGVDPVLMKRFLRFYQSFRWIKETSENQFTANNVTKALSPPGGTGIKYYNTVLNPAFTALPEYFKSHGYKNPTNPLDSPWQLGYNTSEHPFVWLQSHPEHFQLFMSWLPMEREGLPQWLDMFPFEEHVARETKDETVIFVDIGSALGSQSIALREKYPQLKGRVIIQDQQHVIDAWTPNARPGIDAMVYNFFTPQPVKGARAYYMRNIMHDHQDGQCHEILHNIMAAMSHDSVLLIDDIVLREVGAPWRSTMADMNLLSALAAKERSQKEWYALLESAGLKILSIWEYAAETGDSIIVAKPKEFV
ncbi:S-adenosyl-L-methionine-dependent methyltransferase [Massariosphaeria phaeospora]|uniref:S-adenosyl-L-methionine-dependent methyltransferase n=1 Tax=Massariosphaeria phaeospora TaxID=100035 RepID=A0A7C8IAK6_9PLEO|nr:S-adenosyl-L-methionine-dependent methyltransferase [Massariosphaeria phaeospora]